MMICLAQRSCLMKKNDKTVIKEDSDKNGLGKYSYKFSYVNKFMFIPSASALCVGTSGKLDKDLSMTDFYTEPPKVSSSPFDSYYLYDKAVPHISISADVFDWIKKQSELNIVGPQRAESGAKYRVSGMSGMKWYTSDQTKASMTSSGELYVTGSGSVEIIAEKYENGKMYRVRKDVIVDFPDMLLDCEYKAGEGYVSTVSALNVSDMEFIEKLVKSGVLQYEWNILDGDGNLETFESNSSTYSFIPDEKGISTIGVRLVEGDKKGELYSITIDDESIFKLSHPYVIVNSEGTVITPGDVFIGPMSADDRFAVKFNAMPTVKGDDMAETVASMKTDGCYMRCMRRMSLVPLSLSLDYGRYSESNARWEFDFFNSGSFLSDLKEAKSSREDKIIGEYAIILYDSAGKKMLQNMKFTVFSKPNFLVIKPKPDPDPDIPIVRPFE